MNVRVSSLTVVVAAMLVSPAASQDRPKLEFNKTWAKIQKKTYDFKEAGKEMEYGLFVPSTYDKEKKTPLMIALHGLGSNPQQIMRYPQLTDLAEKHGYVVAAPMGYNNSGWYGQKPTFGRKPEPANLHELSEKDVMNVLEIVKKDYNIDPDRIYLMGHSMGGGGTFHLALKYPDIWAALGPIAPAIFRPASEVEKIKHIPVILIQGEKDNLVRVSMVRPWAAKMKELGMKHEYIEVPGGDHINIISKIPEMYEFFNKHKRAAK